MTNKERIKLLKRNLNNSLIRLNNNEITKGYYLELEKDVNNRIKELKNKFDKLIKL
jgi:hypothetical protein